jgi:hypothetical protein
VNSDSQQLHAACSAAVARVLEVLQRHRVTADYLAALAGDLCHEANVHLRSVVERLRALYPADDPLHAQPWFNRWAQACALDYALAFALRDDQVADHFRQFRAADAQRCDILALCYASQLQVHELAALFGVSQLQLHQHANAAWEAFGALARERTGTTWELIFPLPPLLR